MIITSPSILCCSSWMSLRPLAPPVFCIMFQYTMYIHWHKRMQGAGGSASCKCISSSQTQNFKFYECVCICLIANYQCLGIRVCLFLTTNTFVLLAHMIQSMCKTEQTTTHAVPLPMKNVYVSLLLLLASDISPNPGPETPLSIYYINAQSMYNKLDQIAIKLGKFDIVTISETWLDWFNFELWYYHTKLSHACASRQKQAWMWAGYVLQK